MTKLSAGLLMCRVSDGLLQYFLVHPGGPFFKRKDAGFWTIPKGLPAPDEPLLGTAQREFFEETGIRPEPPYFDIGHVIQKGGKVIHAWAFKGMWEPGTGITCNTFSIEWPPRSGKTREFPEIDQGRWFTHQEAVSMMIAEQIPFLERAKEYFTLGQ